MSTVVIDAEYSVIGAMMISPSIVDDVTEILCAEDFSNPENRKIFKAVMDMVNQKIPVEPMTIIDFIDKSGENPNIPLIIELVQGTPSAANYKIYAGIVKECSRKRGLQSILDVCAKSIHDDRGSTADELIAQAAALVGGLQCSDGEGLRNTKQILKALAQKWDRRSQSNGELDGLATGIKTLDERFMGWKPGNLIVIGGRPSMGKSVMGFQTALHNSVNLGKRCMVFSLEMTAEELMERGTAAIGHVHLEVFRKCDKNDFGSKQHEIMSAATRLANADLLIDETPNLHINQIMARARNAHRKKSLSLVVVDHINIVRGDGQNREREVAQITGGLKGLAKELGCPVVAVTQLNRNVESRGDKHPVMSDLRDSGSIEQDADIVILLYRDEYYNEDSPDKGMIEIITGKFREGETGIDRCASLLHESRIGDLSPDYFHRQREESAPVNKKFRV